MTNIEVINLISSIASLILSVIAIWQAMYFYNSSKRTEREVAIALENIKVQSAMLEKMTNRWMERLTRYVTSPKEADETTTKLIELIQVKHQETISLSSPQESQQKTELISELISCYIVIFYYTGTTNLGMQSYLPALQEVYKDNVIKSIVDQSYTEYFYLKGIISRVENSLLSGNPLYERYTLASSWEQNIKDATGVYSARAQVQSES